MRQVQLALLGLLLTTFIIVACGGDDDANDSLVPGQGGNDQQSSDMLQIGAQSLSFDKTRLVAPANTEISLLFQNQDAGVIHNVAIYESRDATEVVFRGDTVTGVASRTYVFTSPDPGSYFFRC